MRSRDSRRGLEQEKHLVEVHDPALPRPVPARARARRGAVRAPRAARRRQSTLRPAPRPGCSSDARDSRADERGHDRECGGCGSPRPALRGSSRLSHANTRGQGGKKCREGFYARATASSDRAPSTVADRLLASPAVGTPCADRRRRPGSTRVGRDAKLASIQTTETRRRALSAGTGRRPRLVGTVTSVSSPLDAHECSPRGTARDRRGHPVPRPTTIGAVDPPQPRRTGTTARVPTRRHEGDGPSPNGVCLHERPGDSNRGVEARVGADRRRHSGDRSRGSPRLRRGPC